MQPPNSNPLEVFGLTVGTYDGWDQSDTLIFTFSEVKLAPDYAKLFGCEAADYLNVDYENGVMTVGNVNAGDLASIKAISINWSNYDA